MNILKIYAMIKQRLENLKLSEDFFTLDNVPLEALPIYLGQSFNGYSNEDGSFSFQNSFIDIIELGQPFSTDETEEETVNRLVSFLKEYRAELGQDPFQLVISVKDTKDCYGILAVH
jgi:hypothetical protein